MANELERMREIRTKQKNIRISLKRREEQNKSIREKITPMWDNPTKEYEVYELSKELAKGRKHVKNYQSALRQFKLDLKETNRSYDLGNR